MSWCRASLAGVQHPEAPSVLIVGGFLTGPYNYGPLRARLLARGAARVDIAPIWPTHWVAAGFAGLAPLMVRTGRAVLNTWRAGGERPIIVVGHSGGGLLTRLATSEVPYRGRRAAVAPAIGAIVTLGTPHRLGPTSRWPAHAGHHAVRFLERNVPGARFAPTTGYLSVGSRFVALASRLDPTVSGSRWRRIGGRMIEEVSTAMLGAWDGADLSDGVVPHGLVHLPGARQLTFDDVLHGHLGGPWYADDKIVERWWPEALEVWHVALAARAGDPLLTGRLRELA